MNADGPKDDAVLGGLSGDTAVVRVAGRGSFKTSPAMKQFALQAIDEKACSRLIFDMADCVSMDSTFMGVVAGVALRSRKSGAASVLMINLTAKTLGLLQTLGLDRLLETHEVGQLPKDVEEKVKSAPPLVDLAAEPSDRVTSVETMLHAHEDLIRADDDNRNRFDDVIDYLGKDLRSMQSDES